jgi:hypothetical protein
VIPRSQLARRLTITEKLDRIVPQVAQRRSIKGLAVGGDFKQLKNLRDDLIHLKMRGYPTDPDEPSALALWPTPRSACRGSNVVWPVGAAENTALSRIGSSSWRKRPSLS